MASFTSDFGYLTVVSKLETKVHAFVVIDGELKLAIIGKIWRIL